MTDDGSRSSPRDERRSRSSPERASNPLEIAYEDHDRVQRLIDAVRYCLEGLSLSFEEYDDPHAKGPGMYVAVVAGRSIADFADPMDDRWPVERCREVFAGADGDLDTFCEVAASVARTHDGAVVVSVDGVIQERLVRFRDYPERTAEYVDWMGTRHMSALDTSRRDAVVATVTLSQESGRVTVFRDGEYESVEREEFAARWHGQRSESP